MKASEEIRRIQRCLRELDGANGPRFIELTDKDAKAVFLVLNFGGAQMWLKPEKDDKTVISTVAGDVIVMGTPIEVKVIFEA